MDDAYKAHYTVSGTWEQMLDKWGLSHYGYDNDN